MTADLLEKALRAYCRRRPFRSFSIEIEFNSGGELLVTHPEAIRREGDLFVGRNVDRRYEVFAASNVSRLVEVIVPGSTHG